MSDATTPGAVNAQIELIDLAAQRRRIGRRMEEAILRVVDHDKYIMGPEVAELEKELAAYCGAKHVLSCANGTDALGLALMARNLKLGQAVLVPSFTFAATARGGGLVRCGPGLCRRTRGHLQHGSGEPRSRSCHCQAVWVGTGRRYTGRPFRFAC